MPFSVTWNTLLERLDALHEEATLITPLSNNRIRITTSKTNASSSSSVTVTLTRRVHSSATSLKRSTGASPRSQASSILIDYHLTLTHIPPS